MQQTSFFKKWLSSPEIRESGRLEKFKNTGLISDFILVVKECISGGSYSDLMTESGFGQFIKNENTRYNLLMYLIWSLRNIASG